MNLWLIINTIIATALFSLLYNNKFFLSLLLSIEVILLNIILLNLYLSITSSNPNYSSFSIFIIAISAVEASIGISIISLISRNFTSTNIANTNSLKN